MASSQRSTGDTAQTIAHLGQSTASTTPVVAPTQPTVDLSSSFLENLPLLKEEYAMDKVACLHLSYSNYESANDAKWPIYRQLLLKQKPSLLLSKERPKDWYGGISQLKGVPEDAKKLKNLLEGKLAYKLFQFSELGKSETETQIDEFIATVNCPDSSFDAVMVFVSGHGGLQANKRVFLTEDGNTFLVEDLISQLEKCTHLAGKPKLVFIDTCQGNKKDEGALAVVSKGNTDKEEEEEEMFIRLPSDSDFLISFANTKGFVCFEHPRWGGLFLGLFRRAILESGHALDLLGLLTLTQNSIARITVDAAANKFVEEKGAKRMVMETQTGHYKQMVNYYSSLRKFVRFPIKGPAS